jgi:DNA-binding NarL/FixJ family response regulator
VVSAERPAGQGAAPTVLIAEDNAGMRQTLRELLEDEGVEVVGEAADGMEAVEQAEALRPTMVLMDLRMPRMDGIEATRLVKQNVPGVRVLMLSAYADPSLSERAMAVGADGYVVKGSSYQTLMDEIQRVASGAGTPPSQPADHVG